MPVFRFQKLWNIMRLSFARPQVIAFAPAVSLAAFWGGGETALLCAALGFPLVFAVLSQDSATPGGNEFRSDSATGLPKRAALLNRLDHIFRLPPDAGTSACLILDVTNLEDLETRFGASATRQLRRAFAERLSATCREQDMLHILGPARFGVVMGSSSALDLEAMIQFSHRLLEAAHQPVSWDGHKINTDCAIGFCLSSRAPSATGLALLDATEAALNDAIHQGPGAIRAYVPALHQKGANPSDKKETVLQALERRQIVAWFQPQICTDTGEITGFEALARWIHPEKGPLSPDHFLPALEAGGAMHQLSAIVLEHALAALRKWDAAGLEVPHVSINLSDAELANPDLVDKINWELDRQMLDPQRLFLEIPENALTDASDDVSRRGLERLHQIGCRIDLDNFGTGNASISTIDRFNIHRLKIDRAFVTGVDHDPEQKRIISAILMMAEQLGLDTLAEGVETPGEHAMLSQLGCRHVQGFGLARPMPLESTLRWIEEHRGNMTRMPMIGGAQH